MKKHLSILMLALLVLLSACGSDDESKTVYTVTFETDGGSPIPSAQKVEEGSTATAPSVNPTKTDYVFLFWHLSGNATAYNFQMPVTGNITLHAKWQEEAGTEYWQVAWNLNGGSWTSEDNHATQVIKGGTLAEPNAPVRSGYAFDGWYKEATLTNKINFPYDVSSATADFTLYAKWSIEGDASSRGEGLYIGSSLTPVNLASVSGSDIVKKAFTYINSRPAADYTLILESDIQMAPTGSGNRGTWATILAKPGAVLTITGKEDAKTITGPDDHYLLGVMEGTLVLDENIILKGKCSGIIVSGEEATAIMRAGSIEVRGFNSAVSIGAKGNFVMEGGSISGNVSPSYSGGGVSVGSDGVFTMKGGFITDNHADNGGGVDVRGTFIVEGGWIGGNQAIANGTVYGITISSSGQGYGGGVNINGGEFIMKGGAIYGSNSAITPNKAPQRTGDALYLWSGSAEFGDGDKIIVTSSGAYNQTLEGRK